MTLEEIEIGQEVICTSIDESAPFDYSINREVGHIGKVSSVFPMEEAVLVSHIEFTGQGESGYAEFLTPFYVNELSIYEPEIRPLQKAIEKHLIQLTRES